MEETDKKSSKPIKMEDTSKMSLRVEFQQFDKKILWSIYQKEFKAVAQVNRWSDEEKALMIALRGAQH